MPSAVPRAVASLSRRLGLRLTVLAVVLASVFIWATARTVESRFADQLRRRSADLATAVFQSAHVMGDSDELRRTVCALGAEEDLDLIVVLGGRPLRVLASNRMELLGLAPDEVLPQDAAVDLGLVAAARQPIWHFHEGEHWFDYALPALLADAPDAAGHTGGAGVFVRLDATYARGELSSSLWGHAVAMLAIVLAVIGAAWWMLRHHVLAPLSAIDRALRQRRAGDATVAWPVLPPDELGRLGAALDEAMSAALGNEARLRSILEHAPEGIVLARRDGSLEGMNSAARRMFGWSAAVSLAGRTIRELWQQEPALADAGESTPMPVESVATRADGTTFPAEVSWNAIRIGLTDLHVAVVRDVSERQTQLDREVESRKMEAVGYLAGGVAHEFNNLLTIIYGHAEIAREALGGAHPHHASLDAILQAAQRAAEVTRMLLSFGRQSILQPRTLVFDELLARVAPVIEQAVGPRVKIQVLPEAPGLQVFVDPVQLQESLVQLALRARHAMPEGGTYRVRSRRIESGESERLRPWSLKPGSYVQLEAVDSRTEVDELALRRAFEPCFAPKGEGIGFDLGLPSVHGFVHQSGGTIFADRPPGVGMRVCLMLPVLEGAPSGADARAGGIVLARESRSPSASPNA